MLIKSVHFRLVNVGLSCKVSVGLPRKPRRVEEEYFFSPLHVSNDAGIDNMAWKVDMECGGEGWSFKIGK